MTGAACAAAAHTSMAVAIGDQTTTLLNDQICHPENPPMFDDKLAREIEKINRQYIKDMEKLQP